MSNTLYPGFEESSIFNRHQDHSKKTTKQKENLTDCFIHEFDEAQLFDGSGNERVCKVCGQVQPTEITEFDKLSGCMDGEQFLKVKYGPGTPPALQSFLLPTIVTQKDLRQHKMKMRDKFVDSDHLIKTRKYTDIQRLCQQYNIPNDYAVEVMRRLLKGKKHLHSRYKVVELLIEIIRTNPILENRVKELKKITKEGIRIEKYLKEIKELKKELLIERRKHTKGKR